MRLVLINILAVRLMMIETPADYRVYFEVKPRSVQAELSGFRSFAQPLTPGN
jgi:hypothetical protein